MPGRGGGWASQATSQTAALLIKTDPSLGHFEPSL